MQLTDARDELAARGFDGLTPARMNGFLNAGKEALENYAPWPWLESTTSGVPPITIADLRTITHVYDPVTNISLNGQTREYLRSMYGPNLTTPGTGGFWYLDGLTTLNVAFPDGNSINVEYLRVSPTLAADADTPLFPDRLDQVWMDLSCAEAYMDADEAAMAQTCIQKAEARMNRELDTYFGRNGQNAELQILTYSSEDW